MCDDKNKEMATLYINYGESDDTIAGQEFVRNVGKILSEFEDEEAWYTKLEEYVERWYRCRPVQFVSLVISYND